ncbi:HAD hydrolase-like protein [Paenibacillus humicola]|uniref:HAD hydrolase-like protein n=1 Tax=Paenibacillus humicola TaxID=3110540 RepID=UPI00237AAED8|nr:HAD hydrolase-like protein [Paenibacillus humicola]
MIRHIAFDFDGTLADSFALVADVYNELAEKYRLRPVRPEEYRALAVLPIRVLLKALGIPAHRVFRFRSIGREFKALYGSGAGGVRLFPGIAELVRGLKTEGYTLTVISSNAGSNISRILADCGLEAFEAVHSSDGLFGKHRTIRRYMRAHGLKPEELLYIGDETRDIEACRKTGVRVIAAAWGFETRERLEAAGPDYIADSPGEAKDYISAIKREAGRSV